MIFRLYFFGQTYIEKLVLCFSPEWLITARQYGEVVLPDASTGQGTGTPSTRGQKAVTVQGGYGALFAVQVQILLSITRVAVQV